MASAGMGTQLSFTTVDVFTDTPYKGNPLAVVHIPKGTNITEEQKLKIAKEFNLSETVFLHESSGESVARQYDIFTKVAEIPFAGHPTIGTLCLIGGENQGNDSQRLRLQCKAGLVDARFDARTMIAEANIPHDFHIHGNPVKQDAIMKVQPELGKKMTAATRQRDHPIVSCVNGMNFMMAELSSVDAELAAVNRAAAELPNSDSLIDQGWARGFIGMYFFVVLDSSAQKTTRLRTRMIDYEIGEDPATGSAACALAMYLARRTAMPEQVHAYEIEQGVEMGRSSLIRVKVELDVKGNIKQISLSGSAVKVMEGKLMV